MAVSKLRLNHTLFTAFTAVVVLGLAFAAPMLRAQPASVDKVIAIVNDDVVLKSEFDERMAQVMQQIANAPGPRPPEAEIRKQILDQLILENLQMQLAQRAGVRVDDNQLNQTMNAIAQQNQMNFEQFTQALEQQGIYQATREAIRKELIIGNFQNGAVNRRINITRQEIENYLRSEAGTAAIAPEFHVAHLLIPTSDTTNAARQKELADELYKQLQAGANIQQLASAGQISGLKVEGGDLGWRKFENLPTVFTDVVPKMSAGDTSEPFSTPGGYRIVQVLETRGGSALKLDQALVRHILIKPTEIRTDEQAKALIDTLYQRIKNGEDFADVARQNTDDANSMVSGGNLDWINDGVLPDDFMAVVKQTPTGTLTPPFRVSTGWHIVEVLDRRIQDVTEDNKRFQAERILRDRKFENELQNWLTEIRDTNYIDIKQF